MSKKSRKLIRSGGAKPVEEPVVEPAGPARDFYFLPDTDPVLVSEADLHDLMKLWRHGRATRTLGQMLSDSYVTLFTVVLLSAMVISAVINAQHGMTGCNTEACDSGRLMVPTATVLACYALTVSVSRLFGPILASAAEGFWLMDAPISRRRLLRGRLTLPLVVAFFVPALIVALVSALSGMDWWSVAAWAVSAALGCVSLMAVSAWEQTHERERALQVIQGVFSAVALLIGVGVVSVAAGWLPTNWLLPAAALRPAVWGVSVFALAVAAVALIVTMRRLELIRRARLVSGGSLISGMQGAMFALDFGLIRDILVERKAAKKGHVRPTKGRGLGISALIWRDLERVFRSPAPLIGLGMSLLVPYAVDALRMSQLNPLVSALALFAALIPFLGSLRVLTRTGGLARSMPFKTTELRTAAMAVPAGLAVLWAVAAIPAFIGIANTGSDRSVFDAVSAALITAAAGLLGAVRWVSAKKPDFQAPMVATASGAVPPTLVFNLVRGFDMVALITAPLILGAPPVWSAALAVLVFIGLRGTFNMDDLKAQQQAAQTEMDRAKADRDQRTKVPRPTR